MLRPKKKISKRELKEDALITTYAKATTWYEHNKKNISIGLVSVAALVIIAVVYINNRNANNEKAGTQLGEIFQYYDNNQFLLAIDGVPERNIVGLRSIVDNYGSTKAGELARFYLANCYYQLGRYDEALKQFEDFSAGEPLLVTSRLAGIGACYEAKSEYADAASSFEKAAMKYPSDVGAAELLNNAARDYAKVGNKERALELYKKIKKDYPKSTVARDVDRFIAELSI